MRIFTFRTQGFTIAELLVVIVVIGILASISIVSYSGITNRANTSSAQSTGRSVAQKVELYNIETGRYPLTTSELTADATKSYYVNSASVTFSTLVAKPTTPNTIKFMKCGTTPNTLQFDITAINITGARLFYWSYSANNASSYVSVGNDFGSGVACPMT